MTFRHDDENKLNLHAAVEALRKGEYLQAYERVGKIDPHSPYGMLAAKLRAEIAETEDADLRDAARAPWYGFAVGLVLYLILSLKSPAGCTPPVWTPLAFIVIPMITGYMTAFFYGFRCERMERFWPAVKAAGFAMACYAAAGLIIARGKITEDVGTDAGGEIAAAIVTVIMFSIIAGAVGGAAGAIRPFTESGSIDDYSEYLNRT